MRIKEKDFLGGELYSSEMESRVKEVFQEAFQISETKRLFTEIKNESAKLRNLFWSEEEQKEKREAAVFFDTRMQAMVFCTLNNLESYLRSGWRELIYKGENDNGTDDSISKSQE